ncbi:unnamed protein product, partial [Amoebophrya sp. A25]
SSSKAKLNEIGAVHRVEKENAAAPTATVGTPAPGRADSAPDRSWKRKTPTIYW